MTDSFKLQGKRRLLADSFRSRGIVDERVIDAIKKVPRHFFVAKGMEDQAYEDKPLPIGVQQTISQPFTVAYQTQLLKVEPRQKILEIGTGSGYQTSILVELGAKVFSIERQEFLFRNASALLKTMGCNASLHYGDGFKGLPTYGPFDRILITAGAPAIPEELLKQLKTGGIMVAPVGTLEKQRMTRIVKISECEYEITEHHDFIFVPMLEGKVSSK